MFGKKNKSEDVNLAIGLHPVEVEVPEKKSSRRLMLVVVIVVVVLAAVIAVLVIGNQVGKQHTATIPTAVPNTSVDGVIGGGVGGDGSTEPSVAPTETPPPSPASSVAPSAGSQAATVAKPGTKEYVDYQNDLLGLTFGFPNKWYVRENTDKALVVLKALGDQGKNFDVNTAKLATTMPVAEFYPKNSANTNVAVTIVPTDLFSKSSKNGVFGELLPTSTTLKADPSKTKALRGYSVSIVNYTLTRPSSKSNCTQYSFPVGTNTFVLNVTSDAGEKTVDTTAVVQEMITSMKSRNGVATK